MTEHPAIIVQRLWNYRNVLRDDGVLYGDYVEQLTYLTFLKMDAEQVFDRRAGGAEAATDTLWIYDLRTNQHFMLKQNPLAREDLDDFVACYNPENRHQRAATWSEDNPDGRWRAFTFDELMARDKANLDIFWIRDESLEETDVLAGAILEDLEAALEQFRTIAEDMGEDNDRLD